MKKEYQEIGLPDDYKKGIGKRLKIFRKFIKLNQTDLGKSVGLKKASISANEVGWNFPSLVLIGYLAKNHDLSLRWLILGEGEMTVKKAEIQPELGFDDMESPETGADLGTTLKLLPFKLLLHQYWLKSRKERVIWNIVITLFLALLLIIGLWR